LRTSASAYRNWDNETIKIIKGEKKVMEEVLAFVSKTETKIDACVDNTRPSLAIEIESIKKAFINAKTRGVTLNYVTEITSENISYCKELANIVTELRHLDGIKGTFYISDSEYIAPATLHEKGKPASQMIYSNIKEIIGHEQYLFETLCSRAIPAEQRIREIEEEVVLGKTEIIYDTSKIQELFTNLVKSANDEILLLLPSVKAFYREARAGVIQLLKATINERTVTVRILTHRLDSVVVDALEKLRQGAREHFKIRYINPAVTEMKTVTILIIDRRVSLAVELRDDSKANFVDAVGLASYSTSKPTILSYLSIFENLWKQVESNEQLVLTNEQLKDSKHQLESANEQLKIHDKMQQEFINIAAHELRTPIQAVLGYAEIANLDPDFNRLNKQKGRFIDMIYKNAVRLQILAKNILDVTRIESNTLKLDKEQFDLREKINNVINDVRRQIEYENDISNKLEILFIEPGNPIIINADRVRIYEVISNLLTNAVKFNKRGTITVTTNVIERHDNGHLLQQREVVTNVRDTGTGIDHEIVPRLFTKFSSKSSSGTGLGLYISKSIVEAHGGRIWAENNAYGNGATFSFSLPLNNQ
jgi:two-component system sensor histidine kinase VicK